MNTAHHGGELLALGISHKHARSQIRQLRRKLGGEEPAPGRSAAPQVSAT